MRFSLRLVSAFLSPCLCLRSLDRDTLLDFARVIATDLQKSQFTSCSHCIFCDERSIEFDLVFLDHLIRHALQMTEPTTPASPRRFSVPDSPLTASQNRLSASSNSASPLNDYDSDEDLIATVAQPTITKSSHRRESSSAALLEAPGTPASPRTQRRQRRLRDYEDDGASAGGPWKSITGFVEKNTGESTSSFLFSHNFD